MVEEKAVEGKVEETKKEEDKKINLMDVLDNPIAKALMDSGKGLFEKKKLDPDMCEITIKAPSAVVLKLFRV